LFLIATYLEWCDLDERRRLERMKDRGRA